MKRKFIAIFSTILFLYSCQKPIFYEGNDAQLEFSNHLVFFDTIFTSLTSVTKQIVVSNPYKQSIKTNISLSGGNSSYYSLNINGVPCTSLKDVEIDGKDSIFIFVRVNIPPNGTNLPMLIADTISFVTNGNKQKIGLLAFGQDAHFILPDATYFGLPCKIVANENETITWKNDKPYVIYGYAVVDSAAQLNIEEGTRIYFHKNGGLLCYIGSCLHVNGTKDNPVTFQGDRTEFWYLQDYAQWDRIWLMESDKNHIINHAIIANSYVGIQAESMENMMGNKLILRNSIIKRNALFGLHTRAYNLLAENNIITDCKTHSVYLSAGGNCELNNNTIYNIYCSDRVVPSVYVSNYYQYSADNTLYTLYGNLNATFTNNIISGQMKNEIKIDSVNDALCDVRFFNCLLKATTETMNSINQQYTIENLDPLFTNADRSQYDFSLTEYSPCKAKGKYISTLTTDILNNPRNNPPSIGAFE